MVGMRQWLVVAAMVVVASVPTERPAGAGTVLLAPEGIDVTGEVAVLEVLPEGHVRVDILVSLADDSVKERDLYVLVPLSQPVEGEVGVGGMPVERFQQDFVDPLIALLYDVLREQKRHEATVARAAMGGGLAAGPLGALAMLHESRQGARRVRGYGRLGAMPEQGTRFRLARVEPRRALRVEELVAMPGLEELAPANWAALEAYEGRPCLLVRARTKRNWRDLRGGEALWSEGLWLGFTQEMAAGGDGALQFAYPLRTAGGDSTSVDVQAVFVTASEATPLTVDFPARQPTDNVVEYEALMAYAEESAAWASRGRQVHMARYDGETPQGEVEIRVRAQGDADFAVSRQAQVWQGRAAWVALPVLGAAIWSLAFLGVGRHSRHVQELPFWQGAWRSWWVAQALLVGSVLLFYWTLGSLFRWPLRYLLASGGPSWAHATYGLSLFLPVVLAVWGLAVLARFRAQGEGRFLLWSVATAVGAGVAYVYAARVAVGWLTG